MQINVTDNYTVITADDGKIFADKEGNIIAKELYLGKLDSPENYTEVEDEKG